MLAITLPMLATRKAGVTFLELVIVLAILALLAVMAVPSIIDRWQRETVTLLAERLASTISLAQRTAQYRHLQTEIAPRDTSTGWTCGLVTDQYWKFGNCCCGPYLGHRFGGGQLC